MKTTIGGMEQKIFDIMTVAPVTVDMQDAVYKVVEVLNEHGLSSVAVIAPESRWTLRDKAAQRRLASRWASEMDRHRGGKNDTDIGSHVYSIGAADRGQSGRANDLP